MSRGFVRVFFDCKYTRWMRRSGLFAYWSAREETDAGARGREDEIEGERKKGLVWAEAAEVNLGLGLHFTVPFAFSIYTRSFLAFFLWVAGSVHRFWWWNRNRTEPERFLVLVIGLIGFSSRFDFLG